MSLFARRQRIVGAILLLLVSGWVQAKQRIVTIGGDLTEIVYALGDGDQLVARDTTSTYPAAAQQLPDVGYMRQLNAEGILALNPTLILASDQAQPALALQQIEQVGIKVVTISGKTELNQVPEKISKIAAVLQRKEQGEALIRQFEQQLAEVSTGAVPTKVLFIMSHQGMAAMVAGQDTAADEIIRASGASNAMQGFSRYRPLSREGLVASQPDLILMSEQGVKSLGGEAQVWLLPGLAMTPAAKRKNLLVVDDMALLSFGLRTPAALKQLRQAVERSE